MKILKYLNVQRKSYKIAKKFKKIGKRLRTLKAFEISVFSIYICTKSVPSEEINNHVFKAVNFKRLSIKRILFITDKTRRNRLQSSTSSGYFTVSHNPLVSSQCDLQIISI